MEAIHDELDVLERQLQEAQREYASLGESQTQGPDWFAQVSTWGLKLSLAEKEKLQHCQQLYSEANTFLAQRHAQ